VSKGADVNAKDNEGRTPLDLAKHSRYNNEEIDEEAVEYLSSVGAKSGKE